MSVERNELTAPEQLLGHSSVDVVKDIFRRSGSIIGFGSLIRYRYSPGRSLDVEESSFPFLSIQAPDLESLVERHSLPGYEIGFSSAVTLIDGSEAHIPMIDFELGVSPSNLERVRERLGRLLLGSEFIIWAVLDSGRSFHAYCLNRIIVVEGSSRRTVLKFAEKCHESLDFDPQIAPMPEEEIYRNYDHNPQTKVSLKKDCVVDPWWLIHSAAKEPSTATLRLTNIVGDKKKIPEVVEIVRSVRDDEYGVFHPWYSREIFLPEIPEDFGVLRLGSDKWTIKDIAWREAWAPCPEVYM